MKFELDLLETIAYDVLDEDEIFSNEKDLAREKSLLKRIEDEVEYYQKAYHIKKKR